MCDINTPIFQLLTFLFVYKRDFSAYAIFIAKDQEKFPAKIIYLVFDMKFRWEMDIWLSDCFSGKTLRKYSDLIVLKIGESQKSKIILRVSI